MRARHPDLPLERVCWIYEVSRQAFYHMQRLMQETKLSDAVVLSLVEKMREDIPRIGSEKMHYKLQDDFKHHQIKRPGQVYQVAPQSQTTHQAKKAMH